MAGGLQEGQAEWARREMRTRGGWGRETRQVLRGLGGSRGGLGLSRERWEPWRAGGQGKAGADSGAHGALWGPLRGGQVMGGCGWRGWGVGLSIPRAWPLGAAGTDGPRHRPVSPGGWGQTPSEVRPCFHSGTSRTGNRVPPPSSGIRIAKRVRPKHRSFLRQLGERSLLQLVEEEGTRLSFSLDWLAGWLISLHGQQWVFTF